MNDKQSIHSELVAPGNWTERSETLTQLIPALIKAKRTFAVIKKERTNPFFKSKYADLSDIMEATDPSLLDNGLILIQEPVVSGSTIGLSTTLIHTSGEYIRSVYPITPAKNDPQGVGSAITYARRYARGAILDVAAEADDDGHAATQPAREARPTAQGKAIQKAAPSFGQPAKNPAAPYSPKAIDWASLPVRYHLPVEKAGADMAQVRAFVKSKGFKFNPEDKHWYGPVILTKLEEYNRPVVVAEQSDDPKQQEIFDNNAAAQEAMGGDGPSWEQDDEPFHYEDPNK